MGRPSLQSERREQILDAFERCIIDFGIEGATLEKLAAYSGLARPLVRHHAGNREDLLEAVIERFFSRSEKLLGQIEAALVPERAADQLLELLFQPYQDDVDYILVAEALIATARHDARLAARMWDWYGDFAEFVARQVRNQFPQAVEDDVREVATGITGIYFSADSFKPLGDTEALAAESRRASKRLLRTLSTVQ